MKKIFLTVFMILPLGLYAQNDISGNAGENANPFFKTNEVKGPLISKEATLDEVKLKST